MRGRDIAFQAPPLFGAPSAAGRRNHLALATFRAPAGCAPVRGDSGGLRCPEHHPNPGRRGAPGDGCRSVADFASGRVDPAPGDGDRSIADFASAHVDRPPGDGCPTDDRGHLCCTLDDA